MNHEIRTLAFTQGVGVFTPPGSSAQTVVAPLSVGSTTLDIEADLALYREVIIEYYLYRRVDPAGTFKSVSGRVKLEGKPDAVLNADRWVKTEPERRENEAASGVTWSLTVTGTGKQKPVVTLAAYAGANPADTIYYKVSYLQV